MPLLRSFLSLTPLQRRVLIKASALLTLVQLGLGRLPFTLLRRSITPIAANAGRVRSDVRQYVETVAWAVSAASRRMPGRSTCLSRALTVQALLARAGCPSRLQVGVMRGPQGAVEGHAWVEYEDRVLIGGSADEIAQFSRLAAFDVETALRLQALATPQGGR
jgi:transglutaminase superfamily protein